MPEKLSTPSLTEPMMLPAGTVTETVAARSSRSLTTTGAGAANANESPRREERRRVVKPFIMIRNKLERMKLVVICELDLFW
jgi:hypothetical protein